MRLEDYIGQVEGRVLCVEGKPFGTIASAVYKRRTNMVTLVVSELGDASVRHEYTCWRYVVVTLATGGTATIPGLGSCSLLVEESCS